MTTRPARSRASRRALLRGRGVRWLAVALLGPTLAACGSDQPVVETAAPEPTAVTSTTDPGEVGQPSTSATADPSVPIGQPAAGDDGDPTAATGDAPGGAPVDAAGPPTEESATPVDPPAGSVAAQPVAPSAGGDGLGLADLERAALQVSDMPDGWSQQATPEAPDTDLTESCPQARSDLDIGAWPTVQKLFEAGGLSTDAVFFSSSIAPDERSAIALMDLLDSLFATCTTWSDGWTTYTFTPAAPAERPPVGDQFLAGQVVGRSLGVRVYVDLVYIREGTMLSSFYVTSALNAPDSAQVNTWVRALDQRD